MKEYKLLRFEKLSGASIESDNSGQTPQEARYRKHFINLETAEVFHITDLQSRKFKRNKHIDIFTRTYQSPFKKKAVSIFSFVVKESHYPSISKFLNMLGKKLSRKQILKLGHVWIRDVGEINFERHYHILIATSRICDTTFRELFSKKRHSNFDVEFLRNTNGLKSYLIKKDLFASKKQRAFGKSKEFKKAN
jgi:hypothetical protein